MSYFKSLQKSFKKVTSVELCLPLVIIVAVLLYMYRKQIRGFIKSTIGVELFSAADSQPSKASSLPSSVAAPSSPPYQESDTWTGPRPGYYFGTVYGRDTRHTGYYIDNRAQ